MIFKVTTTDGKSKLLHSGVKGMKHGERKYQYEDGTLTPEGKIHYKQMRKDREGKLKSLSSYGKSKSSSEETNKPVYTYKVSDKSKKYESKSKPSKDGESSGKKEKNQYKEVSKASESINRNSRNLIRTINEGIDDRKTYKVGPAPEHMSNEQLQKSINRLTLERRYDELTTKTVIDEGKHKTKVALNNLERGLAITGSVVGIAGGIFAILNSLGLLDKNKGN